MLSYIPYQDPGADCAELYDSLGADIHSLHNPVWNQLDPQLGPMNHYQHSISYDWEKQYYNTHRSFSTYDRPAHGFSLDNIQHHNDDHLYQLGLGTAWHSADPDQYRHLRYVSPTDGTSLCSTDSSLSDYTFSPDVARNTCYAGAEVYPSPASDYSRDYLSPVYQRPTSSIAQQFGTSMLSSPVACSMKEVQYTPDSDLAMEDTEIKIKSKCPEELELNGGEETSSPDSGLGRSVAAEEDYDTLKEESDDDDHEFTPTRIARTPKNTTTPLRAALRTSRRPPAIILPAVQDSSARVRKPIATKKRKSTTSTSKSSKASKRPSSTKSKQTEKAFPCPFHTFGCPALFPNKNEWKRHTLSQHLQLGVYRCDLGSCATESVARGYNDFNRKDLFTQHVRRMHRPAGWGGREYGNVGGKERGVFDEWVGGVRERCWVRRRRGVSRGECGVGGCGWVWEGDGDEEGKGWEERMEHMASHYERGVGREEEGVDGGLREWAIREGVVGETTGSLVGLEGKSGEENRKERVVGRRSGYSLRGCRRDEPAEEESEENGGVDVPQKEIEADADADVDADVEDDTDAEAEEDDVVVDDS